MPGRFFNGALRPLLAIQAKPVAAPNRSIVQHPFCAVQRREARLRTKLFQRTMRVVRLTMDSETYLDIRVLVDD